MKNKVLRNIILTVAVSTVIAIPMFAQNIYGFTLAKDIKILSINYAIKNWVEIYLDKLSANFDVDNEDSLSNYDLNNEGIIKSEIAKEVIDKTADELISAIKNKNADKIAEYVHPVKGVRFTPYTTISTENDLIINKENMKNFFTDENSYVWGYYDGIGDEIKLTPSQYYEKFIYSEDFMSATEIGYNEVLSSGNMVENQFEVYKNAIVVEYYIPEINPEYSGLDWQSLRLAFEEYEGNWKLVGIIHNQWTI